MRSSRAWLLDWPLQPLALAPCEVVEIVDEPEIHSFPLGPDWCQALLYWRERLIPLAVPARDIRSAKSVIVVGYQTTARQPLQYAAFGLSAIPRQIEVLDGYDCDAPESRVLRGSTLRASFVYEERAVVVPELATLFGSVAS